MARKKKPSLGLRLPDSLSDPGALENPSEPYVGLELEEPVSPPKKPPKPKAVPREPAGVRLEVFLRVSGKKMDQMGGFRRYAINHGLKQMTINAWRQEYQKFLALPV